jgi:hypothetical protein
MSETIQRAKYAQARVNHAWTAGFVAAGHQTTMGMTATLIWINDLGGSLFTFSSLE